MVRTTATIYDHYHSRSPTRCRLCPAVPRVRRLLPGVPTLRKRSSNVWEVQYRRLRMTVRACRDGEICRPLVNSCMDNGSKATVCAVADSESSASAEASDWVVIRLKKISSMVAPRTSYDATPYGRRFCSRRRSTSSTSFGSLLLRCKEAISGEGDDTYASGDRVCTRSRIFVEDTEASASSLPKVTSTTYPSPSVDLSDTGGPSATSFPGGARTAILSAKKSASSRNCKNQWGKSEAVLPHLGGSTQRTCVVSTMVRS